MTCLDVMIMSHLYEYITQGTSGLVTHCGEDPGCSIINIREERVNMTIDEINKLDVAELDTFAQLARDKLPLPGTKKRMDDILNKPIVVLDFRINKSNKRENSQCLQIQFLDNQNVHVVFTGSAVLINQIQEIKDKLPMKTTVVKIDKYYSFS